jgi:ABC-type transporter Mla subunit MlaD
MALQDLTPQLRTRLTKMDRAVGWFVFLATVLLLFGFGYYLYHAAQRKGWFLVKARFYTYVKSAAGLNIGDPVVLMGFQVGEITGIAAMPPRTPHNVRIDFVINQMNQNGQPYYSYVWSDGSMAKLNSTDFLGKRGLEVTRGTSGFGVYTTRPLHVLTPAEAQDLNDATNWRYAENLLDAQSNVVIRAWTQMTNLTKLAELKSDQVLAFHVSENKRHIAAVWDESSQCYRDYDYRDLDPTNAYELRAEETPAISDQLQAIVLEVQQSLPNVLALTNKLAAVLDHASDATSNLNLTIADTQPLVKNFAAISAELRGPGALGTWVLGSNAPYQVERALTNANSLLVNVDTNLDTLTLQVGQTLVNLANITSNLNTQVQANSNMLWGISKTVRDTDDFIQGLKHHWLLRSAFKKENEAEKNPPPTKTK